MAKGNITKRAVDAVVASSTTQFLWDQEVAGFGLKATPTGSKKYIFQYRPGGREAKVRRVTIGAHGSWTPDGARKEARRLSQLVSQGVDPAAVEQTRRREATELLFPAYAESFIDEYLKAEWKGGHRVASGILRLHVIPRWRQKSLKQITRSDVALVMQSMAGKVAARRNAFTVLRRLFWWAVNRGDLEVSPIRDVEPPPAPAARDRVLTPRELKKVWVAAGSLGYPFGHFVKLLILTGQRLEEVAKLDWRELSRVSARWTLPAKRAKNGVVHEVPLSSQAIGIIDALPGVSVESATPMWPQSGWLFTTRQGKPIAGFSAAKVRLDKLVAVAPDDGQGQEPTPWRFHDLRRSLATGLQRLGVRFEVTEAVLNHLSGSRSGIAGVYQRYNWQEEKREALEAWGREILRIVDD